MKTWKSYLKAKYWEDRMVQSNLQSLIFRNILKIRVVPHKQFLTVFNLMRRLGFFGFCLLLSICLKNIKMKGTLQFP